MPKRTSFVGSGGGWRKPPASMPLKPPISMPPTPHGPVTTLPPPPPKKGAGRKIKGAGIRKQQRGGSKKPMKGGLGLDDFIKPLKHALPIGMGIMTENPYMVAQGIGGLADDYLGGDSGGDSGGGFQQAAMNAAYLGDHASRYRGRRYGTRFAPEDDADEPDMEPVGPSRRQTRSRPVRRLGGPRRMPPRNSSSRALVPVQAKNSAARKRWLDDLD